MSLTVYGTICLVIGVLLAGSYALNAGREFSEAVNGPAITRDIHLLLATVHIVKALAYLLAGLIAKAIFDWMRGMYVAVYSLNRITEDGEASGIS